MSTAVVDVRDATRPDEGACERAGRGVKRIVSIVVGVCMLHAGLLALVLRDGALHSVPVRRQVMIATLIASTAATAAAAVAMPRAMRQAGPAPKPAARREPATSRPPASAYPRAPAHDVPVPDGSRQAPVASADERRSVPSSDAVSNAAQTQTQTPRFVAHPACALVKPDYPPQSLRMGEHGTVIVELETDATGRVVAARVVTGSGYLRLDAAAREAVLASRCAPHLEEGVATPTRAHAPVTFNLDE
ncbi:TonB family protein [Burkholderia multivorans]|uniref:energy transducer TonB n=1 Tax=Burkholderia ubonensis TaxID=101571 RepID=UPI000F70F78D|nr:energy transducer TonB [Burkholderia ubonensis]AYZ62866.1 TonB family protein [Burkholderia multivorans]VWB67968.1 cell envelope biogenesis protein TonB [Burkholderia ubonensis]